MKFKLTILLLINATCTTFSMDRFTDLEAGGTSAEEAEITESNRSLWSRVKDFTLYSLGYLNQQLEEAIKSGNTAAVKDLLARGANIDVNKVDIYNETVLTRVTYRGRAEMLEALLDANRSVEIDYCNLLIVAARNGHKKIVDYVLASGANVNSIEEICWTEFILNLEED